MVVFWVTIWGTMILSWILTRETLEKVYVLRTRFGDVLGVMRHEPGMEDILRASKLRFGPQIILDEETLSSNIAVEVWILDKEGQLPVVLLRNAWEK